MSAKDLWMRTWAVFCARVILGLIFGMAGYYKCFVQGLPAHAAQYFTVPYANSWMPGWLLFAAGVTVPVIELVAGWLVVLGWRTREAFIALGLVLMMVTYGHLLAVHLFDLTGHVLPRLALLVFVSFTPRALDRFSVDALFDQRYISRRRSS